MINPFIYGEEVVGDSFINREDELRMLTRDIESNERIFLISPRRYGKTSLIVSLFSILRERRWLTARIDLYKATSLESLANLYGVSIIRSIESKPEKWIRFLKEFIPMLRPTITINPDGQAELSLNLHPREQNIELLLDKLYNLPEEIAVRHKKRVAIAFDEFQEIRTLNGEKIEKALRANIQRHHNVSYIFAGSKKRMLYDMVSKPSSAFYKMGKVIHLNKINRKDFERFIITKFSQARRSISEDALEKIFTITEEIPYNIQFLCHQIWDKYYGQKKITVDDVEATVKDIAFGQTPIYTTIWDRLTLHQRRVLKAIAASGGKGIFSQDFRQQYGLDSPASVQTSVNSLISHEFLDRENDSYVFLDVFFKEWISRRMSDFGSE
ncbi:hypothetical protein CH333_03535 [candidate division WOR-3 bacterium JGI_Cruoil_03_44_89]|uniref:ATPase domain-containing protein n=1 Tax=candidate division WOR-3 bacterium JGI_Cruoil_03_44_89 TaxID=1973748 RepID=A0A235BVW8_UNCW3|nr:MAG: hypothetical protein CH333_03535 [candidate division WOR-3 bacterium JGI_Cruoil_03_44_89]